MGIWGIAAVAGAAGCLCGFLLARLAGARAGLALVAAALIAAGLLILAGRAEQGWGGIGMVAVAAVMVAPFAGGALCGVGLAWLRARR